MLRPPGLIWPCWAELNVLNRTQHMYRSGLFFTDNRCRLILIFKRRCMCLASIFTPSIPLCCHGCSRWISPVSLRWSTINIIVGQEKRLHCVRMGGRLTAHRPIGLGQAVFTRQCYSDFKFDELKFHTRLLPLFYNSQHARRLLKSRIDRRSSHYAPHCLYLRPRRRLCFHFGLLIPPRLA